MNKNTILWLIVVSVLLTAGAAKAIDRADWHRPAPCFGCHMETLGADAGGGECGDCHNYVIPGGGFNVPLLQSEHNPKICRGCHMGNTLIDASARDIFHNGHNAISCNTCHVSSNSTDNSTTVIKIEGIEEKGFPCTDCHGNQVHSIHIKNLGKTCPLCHGSWAKGKVYTGSATSSSSNTSRQNAALERFTIFAFIKNLINAILGVI